MNHVNKEPEAENQSRESSFTRDINLGGESFRWQKRQYQSWTFLEKDRQFHFSFIW
jgi:hypothetical protein